MVGVRMDHKGQLTEFRAEPRKSVRTTPTKTIPKWEEWFSQEQLGFSLAALTESNWQITPPVVFDQLQSWEGTLPDGNRQIYVQAAAFQGRPVHFVLMDSKAFELTLQDQLAVRGDPPGWAYVLVLDLALIIVLGTRNLYLGRGDRSGATKIVIVLGILALVTWYLNGQHKFNLAEELRGFQSWLGIPAYFAAATWLRYVALEPTIRRMSPDLLISWSRLLKGRFLNPIVQRDILVGLSAGAVVLVSDLAASYWTGESRTLWNDCEALNSNSNAIGVWIHESTCVYDVGIHMDFSHRGTLSSRTQQSSRKLNILRRLVSNGHCRRIVVGPADVWGLPHHHFAGGHSTIWPACTHGNGNHGSANAGHSAHYRHIRILFSTRIGADCLSCRHSLLLLRSIHVTE